MSKSPQSENPPENMFTLENEEFNIIYNQLLNEKEEILENLRQEILINQEQRNYIEILKQTMEQDLIKTGMIKNLEESSKKYNMKPVDLLIDYSKMKMENEKIKKDLIMEQVILTDIKSDLDETKNENIKLVNKNKELVEEINNIKQLISGNIANSGFDLGNKDEIATNLQNLIIDNTQLKDNISKLKSKNDEYEKELINKNEVENKLKNITIQHENILEKNSKLQNDFNELSNKFSEKVKNNEDLIKENITIKDKYNKSKQEIEKLKNNLEETTEKFNNTKKLLEEEQKIIKISLKKSENSNIELTNDIQNKNDQISNLKNVAKEKDKSITDLNSKLSESKIILDKLKDENEKQLILSNQNINSLNDENQKLKYLTKELTKENQNLLEQISRLKDEINKYAIDFQTLKNENEETKTLNNRLRDQFDRTNQEKDILNEEVNKVKTVNGSANNEINYWKEKYENDLNNKEEETNILRNEIEILNYKIDDINRQYMKTMEELNLKEMEIEKYKEREKKVREEFNALKDNNVELNNKIEQHLNDLKREVHTSYDTNSKNNQLTIKVTDLTNKIKKITEENNSLKKIKKEIIDDMNNKNNEIKKKEIELYTIEKNNKNNQKIIDNCLSIIIQYVNKNKNSIKLNKHSLFNNSIDDYVETTIFSKSEEDNNTTIKLKKILNFLNLISTEAEVLFEHIQTLNKLNEDKNFPFPNKNEIISLKKELESNKKVINNLREKIKILEKLNKEEKEKTQKLSLKVFDNMEKINKIVDEDKIENSIIDLPKNNNYDKYLKNESTFEVKRKFRNLFNIDNKPNSQKTLTYEIAEPKKNLDTNKLIIDKYSRQAISPKNNFNYKSNYYEQIDSRTNFMPSTTTGLYRNRSYLY